MKVAALQFGMGAADEIGGGGVEFDEALLGIDGEDAFHHAGEDGFLLVTFAADAERALFELIGDLVERSGKRSKLFNVGKWQFRHRSAV